MKFQHGLLDDETRREREPSDERPAADVLAGKDHLFETLEEETTSERSYLKLLGVVVVFIIVAGAVIFYVTLPGHGDQVRAPKGMELAIRDQMLTRQKRTATDISVYYCGGPYWARIGVESRNDIPGNPLASVKTYTARIISAGKDAWDVDARPLSSPEQDTPCGPLP